MASAIHTLMARGHLTSLLCLLATLLMAHTASNTLWDNARARSHAGLVDVKLPCLVTPLGDMVCIP